MDLALVVKAIDLPFISDATLLVAIMVVWGGATMSANNDFVAPNLDTSGRQPSFLRRQRPSSTMFICVVELGPAQQYPF